MMKKKKNKNNSIINNNNNNNNNNKNIDINEKQKIKGKNNVPLTICGEGGSRETGNLQCSSQKQK